MKLLVVLSCILEDVERTTIGSYGVSGVVWHGTVRKNYVQHVSCDK